MVFDTNILIYAVRDDTEFHADCARRIAEASNIPSSGFLTWNICYEFFRVVTHSRVSTDPWSLEQAQEYIAGLLAAPGFELLLPTTSHLSVLAQTAAEVPSISGSRVHDLHTAVLMREHGVSQICTMDSDFRRFPFIEVVDPTQ